MAGITLQQAQAQLDAYLAAEAKILHGQKVEIDGRALTRADLRFVQSGIDTWNNRVRDLQATSKGRSRMRTVTPVG